MDDGNVIMGEEDQIKLVKIKKRTIENIQNLEADFGSYNYKLSNDRFITAEKYDIGLSFYSYKEGKIIDTKKKK